MVVDRRYLKDRAQALMLKAQRGARGKEEAGDD